MRAVLPVRGSSGDLLPVLAVGQELQKRGHQALVVTHSVYQSRVLAAGLEFHALDTPAEAQAFEAASDLLQEARGGAEFWRRHVIPGLLREVRLLLELQPTLLVLQPVYDAAGRFAAELLGLPACWVFISPAMVTGLPLRIGLYTELAPELNEIRRSLGLAPIHDFQAWLNYARENVGLWPEWFAPDLKRTDIVPVGFPPVEIGEAETAPARVLISGSTGRFLPGSLFDVAVAACARLQVPALVMSRFPDLLPQHLPAGVETIGYQPHRLIMGQASAVIHHGGIGTSLNALAHGRPQLVLAAGGDRPDNGLRLQSLGVGRCLLNARWNPKDVAAALHDVLTSPAVQERAAFYQQALRQSNHCRGVVEVLERALSNPWIPRDCLSGLSPERRKLAEKLLHRRRQQQLDGPRRATAAQQRFWLMQQLQPDSPAFNKVHGVRLTGLLDRARLRQALQALLKRHRVLRTNLRWVEDDLLEVDGGGAEELPPVDLRSLEPALHWQEIQRLGLELVARPYDLSRDPLLRSQLVQVAEHEHVWLIGVHGAVADAASTAIMWRDLGQFYGGPADGDLCLDYGRFTRTAEAALDREALLVWWRRQLAGLSEVDPPLARPRPARLSHAGDGFILMLPKSTLLSLEALARRTGVTLFVLLLAAFKALLLHYTQEIDLVVGTRSAGRLHPDSLALMGPLANTLVLRTSAAGDPPFLEWVERVAAMWRDSQAHQQLPFQTLVEGLQPLRQPNRHPFFSVVFYLQGAALGALPWGDLEARQLLLRRGTTSDDLVLSCRRAEEQLRCLFEYRTALYSAETIQSMAQDWTALLEAICATPRARLSELTPGAVLHSATSSQPVAPAAPLNGPPQGTLETRLARLFAQRLGQPGVRRHDNFFSLGGHSMLAARLLLDIERETGRKLSLTTFFEAPSVAELSAVIQQEPQEKSLVLLQAGSARQVPLVLIHPASGSVSIYRRLIEYLGPGQTVYGLQAVWPGQRTMEAMAEHYAEQVRMLKGPCVLAGLSLGARIALQVAHRLSPDQLRLVLLLDGWAPGYPRFPNLWTRLGVHLRRAWKLPPQQRLDYLILRARAVNDHLRRWLRRLVHRLRPQTDFPGYLSPALSQAAPLRYEGPVLLVRAQEQPVACLPDPRLGWSEQLLPDLEIVEVPGYHGNILHEPHVAELARVVRARL